MYPNVNSSTLLTTATPKKSSKRAFTLIELLIVIAIIALLAAILFPVFSRARENARRASCSSNMKQIGLAMHMYAQDYDETYVLSYKWDFGILPYVQSTGSATQQSDIYGKGVQVFRCPSDTVKRSGSGSRSYAIAAAGEGLGTYGAAGYVIPGDDRGFAGPLIYNGAANCSAGCPSRGRKLSEFPDVAGTLMIVEMPYIQNMIGTANSSVVSRPMSRNSSSCGSAIDARQGGCGQDATAFQGGADRVGNHLEGWNYLFTDGHVKWLNPEKTVGPTVNVWAQTYPYNMGGMWTIAAGD